MPRNPRIDAGGRPNLADDVRRAAFDLCAAARRLHHLTGDPYFKPRMLAGPAGKDLADTQQRLTALLAATLKETR
jgi:hypothetical protein